MSTSSLLLLLHTFGLLLSLVRSHQDPGSVASAKATAVSATVIEFEWGDIVHPSDGLKSFLLRGVNVSGEASVEIDSKERKGRLTNLKPFTNYTTSVISLYSDSNATTEAGVVLTWPTAPSPPNLTSTLASGSKSIALSWIAPETCNGILEDYKAECYRPNDSYPAGSRQVNASTFYAEINGLGANTLYECADLTRNNRTADHQERYCNWTRLCVSGVVESKQRLRHSRSLPH
ncbi:C6 finger domain-containing protein, variant [Sparganum proliferum]